LYIDPTTVQRIGRILLDALSRRLLLRRDVGHFLAWIWLVRQGWLIIPVIDSIGANPVVQVHNATLIGWRERCVGGGPGYCVRIIERDRLV
jgi:hypothetical protein